MGARNGGVVIAEIKGVESLGFLCVCLDGPFGFLFATAGGFLCKGLVRGEEPRSVLRERCDLRLGV